MNAQSPIRIWLLAGLCSVLLAAVVVTLSMPAVQANALLPRSIATTPQGLPISNATPASLAPQITTRPHSGDVLHGVASWYGGVFNGRRTASGERFDMNAMTACHPTLPFGTLVRVVNRENKRSVVVRINDRGYLYDGRILDLSYGAAQRLAMIKPGTTKVDIQVISRGEVK